MRRGTVVFNAARCALELALLDAYGRSFGSGLDALGDVLPGLGADGGSKDAALTAVVPFLDPLRSRAAYLFFRLCGYRSFKIKVGPSKDPRSWAAAVFLAGKARRGRIELRADANGSWRPEEAAELMGKLSALGIHSVEQPVPPDRLSEFRKATRGNDDSFEVAADESVRTPGEAERLAATKACRAFVVRLSKCGGIFPSLQIVAVARSLGLRCRLGAMVGETGLLAAAQDFFMRAASGLDSVEPSLPRLLLRASLARRPSVFGGLTGLWPREGTGLGVSLSERDLGRYAEKMFEKVLGGSGRSAGG